MTLVRLDPSVAEAVGLDTTPRRCVGFAKREGFGGMGILSVYASRAKSPHAMERCPIRLDRTTIACLLARPAPWPQAGTQTLTRRVEAPPDATALTSRLGVTKDGRSGHPLYVHADTPLIAQVS
jgi:hypothetical protein